MSTSVDTTFRWYRKTKLQLMRNYVPGEDMTGISVAEGETPVAGGFIAIDQTTHVKWYVMPEFHKDNYVLEPLL